MDKGQAIFRRRVLEHISAQQLRKATSFLELDVGDRRFRENLVNALAKEGDFGAVLECIKMVDLMNAVKGLELVPEGRSKAKVIKCILASAPRPTVSVLPKVAGRASNRADVGASPRGREHKTATMHLAQLEEDVGGRLGSAVAEVARQAIDPALAPFRRELSELADRLEDSVESLEGQCAEIKRLMTHLLRISSHQQGEHTRNETSPSSANRAPSVGSDGDVEEATDDSEEPTTANNDGEDVRLSVSAANVTPLDEP